MSKKSYRDQSRGRLLSFWEADEGYGAPMGCVTTTYTFDAAFFEEECLARFAGMETDPREDARAYLIEREEKLSQVFACVLVDAGHVAPLRSLRWHQLPARIPGGGIMHAKVTLLVWEHRIRVLTGSANLTEPGHRKNYEHMAVLDFTAQPDLPLSLLEEVLDFFDRLRRLSPGFDETGTEGPQAALERFLAKARAKASSWKSGSWPRGESRATFVSLFPGEESLFERLGKEFPGAAKPNFAWVMSPFFDEAPRARATLRELLRLMSAQGEREIRFAVSGRKLSDDASTIELDLPESLSTPAAGRCFHSFRFIDSRDENGNNRSLHAKSLWLSRDTAAVYLIGSSNFTAAGTGVAGKASNVEANLAYVIPDSGSKFGALCRAADPPGRDLDRSLEQLRFLQSGSDRTPDVSGFAPLPAAFGLALFRPIGEGGELSLQIAGEVPGGFRVFAEEALLLDEDSWQAADPDEPIIVPWNSPRPPSYLRVCWQAADGACEAIWVVNVTDSSLLPPPSELRDLRLDELLDILTSARPLHEAVAQVLKRRAQQGRATADDDSSTFDPHRKVDTRNFLLRRMKRVALGLEGLRERLERPAFHIDALRWRLHGPIGPAALARRLIEQERQAAAFMLAEVALTVRRADWSLVEAGVGRDACRAEVRNVISQLRDYSEALTAPANLAGYVRDAFAEVSR